jgi:hypothetical protein
MKQIKLIQILLCAAIILLYTVDLHAGNEQRGGSSGAPELLINPWAQTSGFGNANVAAVRGLEGVFLNVAGLAHIPRTELIFTNTQWFTGTGISINSFGFGQKVGEAGVLGLSVMSMNFGDIERTTTELPEGGIGTFSPSYSTICLSYAREFSNSIYGGFTAKVINESIHNISASGFALDAGIQYVTGFGKDKAGNRKRDNLRFGITMQNVGSTMKFTGEGMTFFGMAANGTQMTVEHRSQEFELPSLIRIGFSYHIMLAPKIDEARNIVISDHNLIFAASFTSNSFTRDQFHFGMEYGFMDMFFLRGGYIYEDGINSTDNRLTAFTGPTAGMTVNIPTNKEGTGVIGIDYSYRFTNPFGGVHTFGARITLGGDPSGASRL